MGLCVSVGGGVTNEGFPFKWSERTQPYLPHTPFLPFCSDIWDAPSLLPNISLVPPLSKAVICIHPLRRWGTVGPRRRRGLWIFFGDCWHRGRGMGSLGSKRKEKFQKQSQINSCRQKSYLNRLGCWNPANLLRLGKGGGQGWGSKNLPSSKTVPHRRLIKWHCRMAATSCTTEWPSQHGTPHRKLFAPPGARECGDPGGPGGRPQPPPHQPRRQPPGP